MPAHVVHPYGGQKMEFLIGALVGLLLGIAVVVIGLVLWVAEDAANCVAPALFMQWYAFVAHACGWSGRQLSRKGFQPEGLGADWRIWEMGTKVLVGWGTSPH